MEKVSILYIRRGLPYYRYDLRPKKQRFDWSVRCVSLMLQKCCRHWLFGEKLNKEPTAMDTKGWFPRPCVIEVSGDIGDSITDQDKKTS